jgi:hypothetical protein
MHGGRLFIMIAVHAPFGARRASLPVASISMVLPPVVMVVMSASVAARGDRRSGSTESPGVQARRALFHDQDKRRCDADSWCVSRDDIERSTKRSTSTTLGVAAQGAANCFHVGTVLDGEGERDGGVARAGVGARIIFVI